MRRFLLPISAVLWLAVGAECPAATKPNVLLIVADDLGYADVGFNGGRHIATPNLDRLASDSVVFDDFRACPICSPTRAGLMTGRWPIRFGLMRAVVPPWSTHGLPPEADTLAELLGRAGYRHRAIVGKWHLGHARRHFHPLSQGFTFFCGHYNGWVDYFTRHREGQCDWHRDFTTVHAPGYSTDLLAAAAVEFLQQVPKTEPWLLYLPFGAPHAPYQAKAEDLAKYAHLQGDQKTYAAMVDCMDQAIGRVLAAVEDRQETEHTLVWFHSDNGGVARVGDNGRWRAGKGTVYEGGTRVCALLRWPEGGLTGGRRFVPRAGYIDVVPTVLAAATAEIPGGLDGVNLLPALRGDASLPERPWFSYIHQSGEAQASVHLGQWKLVAHGDVFLADQAKPPRLELYDLQSDPSETTNLAVQNPQVVADLLEQLRRFGQWRIAGVGPYIEGREGFQAPKDWVIAQ